MKYAWINQDSLQKHIKKHITGETHPQKIDWEKYEKIKWIDKVKEYHQDYQDLISNYNNLIDGKKDELPTLYTQIANEVISSPSSFYLYKTFKDNVIKVNFENYQSLLVGIKSEDNENKILTCFFKEEKTKLSQMIPIVASTYKNLESLLDKKFCDDYYTNNYNLLNSIHSAVETVNKYYSDRKSNVSPTNSTYQMIVMDNLALKRNISNNTNDLEDKKLFYILSFLNTYFEYAYETEQNNDMKVIYNAITLKCQRLLQKKYDFKIEKKLKPQDISQELQDAINKQLISYRKYLNEFDSHTIIDEQEDTYFSFLLMKLFYASIADKECHHDVNDYSIDFKTNYGSETIYDLAYDIVFRLCNEFRCC